MFAVSNHLRRFRSLAAFFRKIVVAVFTITGAVWMCGGPVLRLILSPMYETHVVRRLYSSDLAAVAEVEVTTGGLGTVWTTRVHARHVGSESWTVYQSKDSDFVPPLVWKNARTLVVSLPCDRFDYISNPDDWGRQDSRSESLKIRFGYISGCE